MEFRLPDEPVGGILTALACGTAALWRHNHYSAALGGMAAQFGGTGGTIWRHGGAAGGTDWRHGVTGGTGGTANPACSVEHTRAVCDARHDAVTN